MRKYLQYQIGDAHLDWRCTSSMWNNHYAMFENIEIKTVGVTDYTKSTASKHFRTEQRLSSALRGAHFHCEQT